VSPPAAPPARESGSVPLSAGPSPTPAGLAEAPHAIFGPVRGWYTVPDPAFREDVHVAVTFPGGDVAAGRPRARLRSNGNVVDLVQRPDLPASWQAELPLDDVAPRAQRPEV